MCLLPHPEITALILPQPTSKGAAEGFPGWMRVPGWPEGEGGKGRRGRGLAGVQTPLATDRCTAPVAHMFSRSHVCVCVSVVVCMCVWSLDSPEYQLCAMKFPALAFKHLQPWLPKKHTHIHTHKVFFHIQSPCETHTYSHVSCNQHTSVKRVYSCIN